MKWKIFCIAILLPCFVLSANAHPGGTDSKGGHKNHSTGEYHYHHGYSEHQHYDINGDGIVDCPYTYQPSKTENKPSTTTKPKTSAQTQSSTEKLAKKVLIFVHRIILSILVLFVPALIAILIRRKK
jgi:hypothetical protein